MAKKALITGITGQDGSYLAELLLSKGYEVHGIIRRASTFNTGRLEAIYQDPHESGKRLSLHYGDLSDGSAMSRLLGKIQPEEIYNLAAQDHARRGAHQKRSAEEIVSRQPRCETRLGLREGIRRGHVAHAPATRGGRLRDRDERNPFRAGVS